MSDVSLTGALKFVEEHSGRVFSDLQRVSVTLLLIYVAMPKLDFKNYVGQAWQLAEQTSHNKEVVDTLGYFAPNIAERSEALIFQFVVIWVIYQLALVLHDTTLVFLHNLLPSIRLGRINTTANEVQRIRDFCFLYFEKKMNRESFDILFGIYEQKLFKEIDIPLSATAGRRFSFIKERIFIFLIAAWFGGASALTVFVVVFIMTLLAFFISSQRSEDFFILTLTQRVARELVAPYLGEKIDETGKEQAYDFHPRWMFSIDWLGIVHFSAFDWRVRLTGTHFRWVSPDMRKLFHEKHVIK